MKDRLEIYDKVNQCDTYAEIAEVIRELADEDGMIQGRIKKFNAEKMAKNCENFEILFEMGLANGLTREFGIRQQAMYVNYYSK